jgi:hypothetical protein
MERIWVLRTASITAFMLGQIMLYLIDAPASAQILYGLLFVGMLIGYKLDYYIFIIRVVTPVTIGIFFALLYNYSYSTEGIADFLSSSFRINFMVDKLFKVISTLYAITTAFLLWKGLSDYDSLKQAINEEAATIRNIINYTYYFHTEDNIRTARNITRLLVEYADNILAQNRIISRAENEEILFKLIKETEKIDPADKNDEIALEEIMRGITHLSRVRSQRQSLLEAKMSPYLLFALAVMSLAIIYPLFTKPPNETGSAGYITIFTMSSLLSFMFITMLDIRDPFAGFWKIKVDALKDIVDKKWKRPHGQQN